jgi:hypothetical protein
MPDGRDSFAIDGECWCPGEIRLDTLRIMGHTQACTAARKGHEANRRHLSDLDRQRRTDESAGRQLREMASAVLERERIESES